MAATIFDIDGTLVTFKFDVEGARRALLEELSTMKLSIEGLGVTTPIQRIIDSAFAQAFSGETELDYESVKRRVYGVLDAFEVQSASASSILPGVREVLQLLSSKGVRLAVMTNSGRASANKVLSEGNVIQFFEFVLTRDDIEAMKPRPEGVAKAVAALALPRDSVCYVGDSVYDITAAKLAGIRVISVATGNYTPDRLREEGADEVISSLSELPRAIGIT